MTSFIDDTKSTYLLKNSQRTSGGSSSEHGLKSTVPDVGRFFSARNTSEYEIHVSCRHQSKNDYLLISREQLEQWFSTGVHRQTSRD
jgi:hypothetical protein